MTSTSRAACSSRPVPLIPDARTGRLLALAGIILSALGMRTAVAVISPIADRIAVDIPFGSVGLGVLGMLPPVGFAIFALLTPALVARLGLERSMIVALVAMAAGHVVRALAGDFGTLLAGTALAIVGIGIGNVLLPPLVRRWFPTRIGVLTAAVTTLMSVSTAVPSVLAVPIASGAGWRLALGIWSVLALTALVPWALLSASIRRSSPSAEKLAPEPSPELLSRLWKSPTAIAIGVVFATSAIAVYAFFAWLPQILTERAGVDEATAGALLSLYALAGFPVSIVMPLLVARLRNVAPLVFLGVALFVVGYGGLLLVPATGTWVWVLLAGLGPLLFPVALALISLRTRTHSGTVAVSGFAQAIGYSIGALGPLLVGVLHQLTGGYDAPLIAMILVSLPAVAAGIVLRRPRFVEDELPSRSSP